MKKRLLSALAMALVLALLIPAFAVAEDAPLTANKTKVRTIITTDGETDDQLSLLRLMLYANEFELEGIVSSSSMFHFTDQGEGRFKGKDSNQRIIDAYAKVYDNLSLHADGYPTPEYLTAHNFEGNVAQPSEIDTDTDGSLFIKSIIMDEREDRVLLQAWGGVNTIASALRSIQDDYKDTDQWDEIYAKVCNKVVIINDLDQDTTVTGYIFDNWPNLPVLMTFAQYNAIAYGSARTAIVPEDLENTYYSAEFLSKYIANRGALSDAYMEIVNARAKGGFLGEGDTPCFFYGLDVGLRSYEDPAFGGWGGRYDRVYSPHNGYSTAFRKSSFPQTTYRILGLFVDVGDDGDYAKPLYRWIPAFQSDWAARMNWCVASYEEANHEPVVQVEQGIDIAAQRGETVTLTAKTYDPDGDKVNVTFWQYDAADTYGGKVELVAAEGDQVSLVVPADAKIGDTIHIIVEAQDDDEATPITRYQRVVITVMSAPAE